MAHNGHPHLQPANDLPIVGQPFTIKSWHPTVLGVCHCDGDHPILLVGIGNPVPCPKCGKGYVVQGVLHDAETGRGAVTIGQAVVRKVAGT
jgi:hypothetical protein